MTVPFVVCGVTKIYLISEIISNQSQVFVSRTDGQYRLYMYPHNYTALSYYLSEIQSNSDCVYQLVQGEWIELG